MSGDCDEFFAYKKFLAFKKSVNFLQKIWLFFKKVLNLGKNSFVILSECEVSTNFRQNVLKLWILRLLSQAQNDEINTFFEKELTKTP